MIYLNYCSLFDFYPFVDHHTLPGATYLLFFNMAQLKPFKGSYYLWEYVPSLPGAIAFTVAFLLITLAQGYRMYRGKHWFTIPFFIGGICQSLLPLPLSLPLLIPAQAKYSVMSSVP